MKIIGRLTGLAVAVAVGFFARGLIPAGGPPSGMAGMRIVPPAAVVAQELKEAPLEVLDEFIASVEPVQEVMVRTQVAGYIDEVHFQEGATVNEGDLLFTIQQETFEAEVASSEAGLAQAASGLPAAQANFDAAQANFEAAQADLDAAQANFERADAFLKRLKNADERSIIQSDMDAATADFLEAKARVQQSKAAIRQADATIRQVKAEIQQTEAAIEQAKADLTLARIDLAFTEIRSHISGRIGKALATKGNYVTPSSDTLAHIVQTDPIRAVFSLTDRAYLNLRRQELDSEANALAARVRLPNGATLKRVGKKDFDDNVMSSETGTMAVRYLFDNADGLLVPGGYVNILLGQQERPMGIRVPQQAVLVDPQGSYVLTVDEAGQVGMVRVKLGQSVASDFVVLSGLEAGDRVVVDGLQKVQPGAVANVTLREVTL